VVGCDGAHSRVRHDLGLPFHGQPYPQDFLLADVALDGAGREDEVHAFFRPDGLPLICLPMRGHRWRVATVANAGDRGGQPPSLEEIQDLVDQRGSLSPTRCGWQFSGATSDQRRRTGAGGSCWLAMLCIFTPRQVVRA
jgi:2-polyprenyl-6-methoxyphenol hydroxylase-like FAD-dependent oxidoreductase